LREKIQVIKTSNKVENMEKPNKDPDSFRKYNSPLSFDAFTSWGIPKTSKELPSINMVISIREVATL
jgi:hypothetical protein